MNFAFDPSLLDDSDLDSVPAAPQAAPVTRVTSTAPVATSSVRTGPTSRIARTYLIKSPEHWTWSELRDYVLAQIELRDGTTGPRSETREFGIFSRFAREYGEQAGAIAKFAFETCGGHWKGSPVGIGRFAKASDDYFAREILTKHLYQKVH